MTDFNIDRKKSSKGDEYIIIEMPKEMPSDKVSPFEREVIDIIQKENHFIIIDFSNMTYICSRGVGIIAYALGKVRKQGGDIKLLSLTPFVKKLFEVIQLDQIFEIYENLDSILEKN